jgi:hypothetical protein
MNRVLVENLLVAQLLKCSALYGNRGFTLMFTTSRHLALSWARFRFLFLVRCGIFYTVVSSCVIEQKDMMANE